MKNKKVTSRKTASKASKPLTIKSTGEESKSVAGSALSQRKAPSKQTSSHAASIASKVLRNPRSSKDAKSAAGSALTQRPNRKKGDRTAPHSGKRTSSSTGPRKK